MLFAFLYYGGRVSFFQDQVYHKAAAAQEEGGIGRGQVSTLVKLPRDEGVWGYGCCRTCHAEDSEQRPTPAPGRARPRLSPTRRSSASFRQMLFFSGRCRQAARCGMAFPVSELAQTPLPSLCKPWRGPQVSQVECGWGPVSIGHPPLGPLAPLKLSCAGTRKGIFPSLIV